MDVVTLALAKEFARQTAIGAGGLVGPAGPQGLPGKDGVDGADGPVYLVINGTLDSAPLQNSDYEIQLDWLNRTPIGEDEPCSGIITAEDIAYYVSGEVHKITSGNSVSWEMSVDKVTRLTGEDGSGGGASDIASGFILFGKLDGVPSIDEEMSLTDSFFIGSKPVVDNIVAKNGIIKANNKVYFVRFKVIGTDESYSKIKYVEEPILLSNEDNLIDRCMWFHSAGQDLSLYQKDKTNIAGFNEFIGAKPKVTSKYGHEYGIILVEDRLYWTHFQITEVDDEDAYAEQLFLEDPILIGPIDDSTNVTDGMMLFAPVGTKIPKKNDTESFGLFAFIGKKPEVSIVQNMGLIWANDELYFVKYVVNNVTDTDATIQYVDEPKLVVNSSGSNSDIAYGIYCFVYEPTIENNTVKAHVQRFVGKIPEVGNWGTLIYIKDGHYYLASATVQAEADSGGIVTLQIGSNVKQIDAPDLSNYYTKSEVNDMIDQIGEDTKIKPLTQAEYDALSSEQKNADIVYLITDG